jgi:hypothetical protein
MMTDRTPVQGLALAGALLATWDGLHPLFDQWFQAGADAKNKGAHGRHRVYRDGTVVGQEDAGDDRSGQRTMTASRLGWLSAARHVAAYSAGQLVGTIAVTRTLGHRVPAGALLTGAAVNAVTHVVIDRRRPLIWLADKAGKGGYVEHCTVVRKIDESGDAQTETSGPGSAVFELDQALHRAIGVGAALTTTWLTLRATKKGRA